MSIGGKGILKNYHHALLFEEHLDGALLFRQRQSHEEETDLMDDAILSICAGLGNDYAGDVREPLAKRSVNGQTSGCC